MIIPAITLTYEHPFYMEDASIIYEQIFRGYTSYEDLNNAILRWITDIQDTDIIEIDKNN